MQDYLYRQIMKGAYGMKSRSYSAKQTVELPGFLKPLRFISYFLFFGG